MLLILFDPTDQNCRLSNQQHCLLSFQAEESLQQNHGLSDEMQAFCGKSIWRKAMKRFFGRRQQERENEDRIRTSFAQCLCIIHGRNERNNNDLPEFMTKCGTHDEEEKKRTTWEVILHLWSNVFCRGMVATFLPCVLTLPFCSPVLFVFLIAIIVTFGWPRWEYWWLKHRTKARERGTAYPFLASFS